MLGMKTREVRHSRLGSPESPQYKNKTLDRKRLASRDGVEYFKQKMRPFFIKGEQYVFLWRFLGLFKALSLRLSSSNYETHG